jgi:tetratricopeptide (TPR) repeat protein
MPIVAAKCTNCGASLKVNTETKAAICEYCHAAFVVEDAINDFRNSNIENVNIADSTVNIFSGESSKDKATNLARRAEVFINEGEYDRAEEYLDKALDLDIDNETALRVKGDSRLSVIGTPNCRITSNCSGLAVVVKAFIDGIAVAKLHCGQHVDVTIPTKGRHTITVQSTAYGKYSEQVFIKSRHTVVHVVAKYKSMGFRITAEIQVIET